MKQGIIYGLICPETNLVRYIGQTKNNVNTRIRSHTNESKMAKESYTHKERWIRSILQKGKSVEFVVLETTLIEQLNEREKFWISSFSNLTNATDGGQCQYELSNEAKEKISISKQGANNPMFGKRFSMTASHKEEISKALRSSEKLKHSRQSKNYKEKISKFQSKGWYLLDENRNIIQEFANAREIGEHLGVCSSNVKNARRFNRWIGKSLGKKYYVVYKSDQGNLVLAKP